MTERPLLVVDGDNLAHRAYHAMPKSLKGAGGRTINSVVGWTNMMLTVWDAEAPRAVFVAWDTLDSPTYRHELWPTYQAGRVFDRALLEQLDVLPLVAAAFGFGVGKATGYEADDLMAAAAIAETARGGHSLLLTTDRDAYQLVNDSVMVLAPRSGVRDLMRIGPAEVVERFGVLPEQVPDFKALAGDASDNIPGAKGVGPRSAAALLLKHGTLDDVIEAWGGGLSPDQAERLRTFREVVRMRPEVPVALPETGPPTWQRAAETLLALGADRLAERVASRA
jgi:DNA polymerase I